LKQAVADKLGSTAQDIYFTDVQELKTLFALDMGIESLDGIECLVNVAMLVLEFNEISDLTPLGNLTNLEELWLSANHIADLGPLTGLANLEVLWFSHNEIVDLTALVDNPGIDAGDKISVTSNPLDCEEQAENIAELLDRGVLLETDCE